MGGWSLEVLKVSSDSIFLQCLRDCDSQPALPLSHYGWVFYRRGGVGYCRPQTHRQPDWFSPLDLCGISHTGELAGTAGSLRHCWKRESCEWAGFFLSLSLVLWPLRFPPVLTWLRLYNSPERVTSSWVKIPGRFFSLSLHPISFFPFTGRVEWGGAVIVEHLSSSQLQRQGQPVIYGNICKMQSPCICF